MDTTALIELLIVIVVIYFFIKFIVSPVIKIVLGIIIFLVLLYILQRFFGFDFDKVLAPFGVSLNTNNWGLNFNFITTPINYITGLIKPFINFILQNVPKAINK